jgi:hypothetical protein
LNQSRLEIHDFIFVAVVVSYALQAHLAECHLELTCWDRRRARRESGQQ